MDFYIHYTALPQGKSLADVVGELNEVLEDGGADEAAVYRAMAADGAQAAPAVWPWILVICIGAAAVVLAELAKKGVLHGKR